MNETELNSAIRRLNYWANQFKFMTQTAERVPPDVYEMIEGNERVLQKVMKTLQLMHPLAEKTKKLNIDVFFYNERVDELRKKMDKEMKEGDLIRKTKDVDEGMISDLSMISVNGRHHHDKSFNSMDSLWITNERVDCRTSESPEIQKRKDLLKKLNSFKEGQPSGEAIGYVDSIKKILEELKEINMDMMESSLNTKIRRIFVDRFLNETQKGLPADKYVEQFHEAHNKCANDIRNYNITSVLKRMQSYKPVTLGDEKIKPSTTASFATSYERCRLSQGRYDEKYVCFFCQGGHKAVNCNKYNQMEERKRRVEELSLCLKCLLPRCNHRFCRAQNDCSRCGGEHHRALCGVYHR